MRTRYLALKFLSCGILLLVMLTSGCSRVSMRQQEDFTLHYDFEGTISDEWTRKDTYLIDGQKVLGLYNDRKRKYPPGVHLRLTDIPANHRLTITLDLYLIGTWDSSGHMADRWHMKTTSGHTLIYMEQFPNRFADPKEKEPIDHQGFVEVYSHPRAYWVVSQTAVVPPEQIKNGELTIVFRGYLTGRKTELWAIDNVRISAEPVP